MKKMRARLKKVRRNREAATSHLLQVDLCRKGFFSCTEEIFLR